MIRISVVLVDRANYGRLKPLLLQIQKDNTFDLSVICCGSMVLKRFHHPVDDVARDLNVTHRIYNEVEGSIDDTVVFSMSNLMQQLVHAFKETKPDFVLIIGDRYEALAVASVATIMKLCLIHVQGGEHSGNIDDAIRHAISKLATYHIPATVEAAAYLSNNLDEINKHILGVGCPSVDMVDTIPIREELREHVLCIYHPEDCINNYAVVTHLLDTLGQLNKPVMMFWPNIDSGSESITKVIRRFITRTEPDWLSMVVNMQPEEYLSVLKSVRCCVGNSSSFVRDASFFGTPVVLMGNRQIGRIKTDNVKWVKSSEYDGLMAIILEQCQTHYKPSHVFGHPGISKFVVENLKRIKVKRLKAVEYV